MKVKIGNTWHDANDEPIMLQLNDCDKTNIANMHPEATKYADIPARMNESEVEAWMDDKMEPEGTIKRCDLG